MLSYEIIQSINQLGTGVGSHLVELFITDMDSPSNSGPFQCTLLRGDTARFSVTMGTHNKNNNNNNCIVKSNVFLRLEHLQERDTYNLVVRVTDAGR